MSFTFKNVLATTGRPGKAVYVLIALMLIAGGALGLYGLFSQSVAPVVSLVIDRGDIEKTVLATGIIKPSFQVNVGAQVNGQLKKLHVKVGDRVIRGQLLAEIDPVLQKSELRKSEAVLESAVAQKQASQFTLAQYQLELKRQQQMDREGSGTKSTLEEAQAKVDTQRAQIRVNDAQIVQAEMALETAKANLSYTRILAPADGQVLGIVTKEGQTVVSSQIAPTILVLANVDTMTIQTRISETDILKVRPGQPLWFYVVANPEHRYHSVMGTLQNAPNEALQDDGARPQGQQASAVYYNGVFSVPNPEQRLRTSMTAQVFIITRQVKNVLRLPLIALGQPLSENRYQVLVVKGDKTERRLVHTGINNRQFIEVKEGLEEGEHVVITQSAAGAANG